MGKKAKLEASIDHKKIDVTSWNLNTAKESFEIYFKLNNMKEDRRFRKHFLRSVNKTNFFDIWKIGQYFGWIDKQVFDDILSEIFQEEILGGNILELVAMGEKLGG